MGSLILGWILVALGSMSAVVGLAVTTIQALRGDAAAGAFGVADPTKFLELLKGLLEQLAKFTVGVQLLLVGVLLLAGGTCLLIYQPF